MVLEGIVWYTDLVTEYLPNRTAGIIYPGNNGMTYRMKDKAGISYSGQEAERQGKTGEDIEMSKIKNKMMVAMCCTGLLVLGSVGLAQAQSPTILAGGRYQERQSGPGVKDAWEQENDIIRIWGPVLGTEDGSIRIDNQSGISFEGEIVLNIDKEHSRVLEGVNGFPVEVRDIKEGDFIYAYIGPAMTMSLPPMTTAEMVVCQIPQDKSAPGYVKVKSMQQQETGDWNLTATDGTVYHVPEDCQILPYLTRNIVRLEDVTDSSTCMVWTDAAGSVEKIVLFARDAEQAAGE